MLARHSHEGVRKQQDMQIEPEATSGAGLGATRHGIVEVHRVGRDGYVQVIDSVVTLCLGHDAACKSGKDVPSKLVLRRRFRKHVVPR